MMFRDRIDAGRRLAHALGRFRDQQPIVLGLPRGGVVVAGEIAAALGAPLDVLVVRKLGAPGAEEFAIGAIAPGATLLNRELVLRLGISRDYLMRIISRETEELRRREEVYRNGSPAPDVRGRTVILVDDGLATGATAQAAIESLRRQQPRRIVFAAPVCSPEGAEALRQVADEVECLLCPRDLRAVGEWYEDFSPTSDAQVIQCLGSARSMRVSA
ncbi:MAG TPA: phosphoribosyltransferase family protein [Gemmatimonadales bacterium]|jgi:predicted phosphoribosyltransferase